MDQIDHGLKEFVDGQRKYLSIRNNTELMKFKENISAKDLSEALFTCQLTTDQVCLIQNFPYYHYYVDDHLLLLFI